MSWLVESRLLGKLHAHHLRLRERRDFDRELAGWLRQSYVEYRRRGWLTKKHVGDHLGGRAE